MLLCYTLCLRTSELINSNGSHGGQALGWKHPNRSSDGRSAEEFRVGLECYYRRISLKVADCTLRQKLACADDRDPAVIGHRYFGRYLAVSVWTRWPDASQAAPWPARRAAVASSRRVKRSRPSRA